MIKLVNLTKEYRRGRTVKRALKSISMDVPAGTVFTLLGPNGAGKTTLLNILATMVLPTSGDAILGGYSVLQHPRQVRQIVGLGLGGERSFYFRLTGRQNLEFFGALAGLGAAQTRQRTARLLELFDLTDAADVPYMKYSTGMKKKLALARALITDAPILLLDEPTAGVDPVSALKIRNTAVDLARQGKTIVWTTHDLAEAEAIGSVVGILHRGDMLAVKTVDELRRFGGCAVIRLRAPLTGPDPSEVLPSLRCIQTHDDGTATWSMPFDSSREPLASILSQLLDSKVDLREVGTELPSLEDVFFSMTKR